MKGLTITPKLKLRDEDRKALLSWILKFLLPGMRRTTRSIHIMAAPKVQACVGTAVSIRKRHELRLCTYAAHSGHDPSPRIIFEHHVDGGEGSSF